MNDQEYSYEVVESNVPLDGLRETVEELIELYGGRWEGERDGAMLFSLPSRRGVGAGDQIGCELTSEMSDDEGGIVRLRSYIRSDKSPARIVLLLTGVLGAMLWLIWPFFPDMGPVAVVGGIIAFAAYFLSLRRSPAGLMYDFLQRLARTQRNPEITESE